MWPWRKMPKDKIEYRKRSIAQSKVRRDLDKAFEQAQSAFWFGYMRRLETIYGGCSEDEFRQIECPLCRVGFELAIDSVDKCLYVYCTSLFGGYHCGFNVIVAWPPGTIPTWWHKSQPEELLPYRNINLGRDGEKYRKDVFVPLADHLILKDGEFVRPTTIR